MLDVLTDIKEHKKNKLNLLGLINQLEISKISNKSDSISKTDWNLPKEVKRNYLTLFYDMIRPYMNDMATKMKFNKWNIDNAWFQIYDKDDQHGWHVHNSSNWTNIYYLNLPENGIKTEIYDVKNEQIIKDIHVKEGQLLTIPAGILHRSPKNLTNELKVVIAFNSNFDDVALTI